MATQTTPTDGGTVTTTTGPSGDGQGTSTTVQFTPTPGTAPDNQTTLLARALTALQNNATFLAIAAPTNAQAVAQVQALTRQVDALIRLRLNATATITDA